MGNVALKASEGVAKLILNIAREEFNRDWFSRLVALLCKPVLKRVFGRTDLNKFNGASLLGLRGVVVKSHGGANAESFTTAIRKAIKEAEMNVPEKIRVAVAAKHVAEACNIMKYAKIAATGSYLPEKILTNHDLAKMMDTSDEWIVQRTGIKQRHVVTEHDNVVTMAASAARKALEAAAVATTRYRYDYSGYMSLQSVCISFHSMFVTNRIGHTQIVRHLIVQAACSGFIYALSVATSLLRPRRSKRVLLVGSEAMSKVVDWEDRASCILFGDGAGAIILEHLILLGCYRHI